MGSYMVQNAEKGTAKVRLGFHIIKNAEIR